MSSLYDTVKGDLPAMDLKLMNKCRKEGKYVDFTIKVEEKSFQVHRIVLDTKSEYFKLLFTTGMKESEERCCQMHEVTAQAVERVLDFMYGEELALDENAIADVLKVCHMWQLDQGLKRCERFLIENLSLDNFLDSIKLAKFYELKNLRKKCYEFILSNLNDVKQWSGMKELQRSNLLDIIGVAADMNNTMSDVWKACIEWDKRQNMDGSALCVLIQEIPSLMFQNSNFLSTLYNDAHVEGCERCRGRVESLIGSLGSGKFDARNAVPIKLVAKRFALRKTEKAADAYIVEHHKDVLATNSVVNLEEADLMQYMLLIKDGCTSDELSGIFRWMRHSRQREDLFPKIFDEKQLKTDSPYVKSVRDFTETLKPEEFFFVVRLAEKDNITCVLKTLTKYLDANLPRIAQLPEFKELAVERVAKYLKIASSCYLRNFTENHQKILWDTAMGWLNHDRHERRRYFFYLLKALPMEDFSYAFIKDTVLKCGLLSDADTVLTNIVLKKAMRSSSGKNPHVLLLHRR